MTQRLFFFAFLVCLLAGCATQSVAAPVPTPSSSPAHVQLATSYSGTLTSSLTGNTVNLQLTNSIEDSTGHFTDTLIVGGDGGTSYFSRGYVDKNSVAFNVINSDLIWLFSGTIDASGKMSGTVSLSTQDNGQSTWSLFPG